MNFSHMLIWHYHTGAIITVKLQTPIYSRRPFPLLTGETAEERKEAWFNHFRNLLGNPPVINNEDGVIDPVMEALPIEDELFTLKEY